MEAELPGMTSSYRLICNPRRDRLTVIRCPFHPRVTAAARKRPLSFCQKCRWQVTPTHACTLGPTKSEWADYAVQVKSENLSGKRADTQLVKKHTATVVSAR